MRVCYYLVFLWFLRVAFAQVGGTQGYHFVNFPLNAKQSAIGGKNVSSMGTDPNLIQAQPALLQSEMLGKGAISYVPFFAGIWGTQVNGVFEAGKKNRRYGMGLQYFHYGQAKRTDATGQVLGTVSASDFYAMFCHARTLHSFTLGVAGKFVGSQLDNQTSYAVLIDAGVLWKHPKKEFTVGLCVKNLGFPVKNYDSGNWVHAPIDVQAGVSYKLEHLPFQFSVTLHHMYRWDITYRDPASETSADALWVAQQSGFTWYDNLFRHMVFGGEFYAAKGFHLRAGYNHLIRRELQLPAELGASGFSAGFMFQVQAFQLGYTSMFLHTVGHTSIFTLSVHFAKLNNGLRRNSPQYPPTDIVVPIESDVPENVPSAP